MFTRSDESAVGIDTGALRAAHLDTVQFTATAVLPSRRVARSNPDWPGRSSRQSRSNVKHGCSLRSRDDSSTISVRPDRLSAIIEERSVSEVAEQLLRSHPKPRARDRALVIAGVAVAVPAGLVVLARYGLSRLRTRRGSPEPASPSSPQQ